MKNAIKYYYNINAKDIHQKDKNYRFNDETNNNLYLLNQYSQDPHKIVEIIKIYQYIRQKGLYCHEIILNNNNEIITNLNGLNYVLLRINMDNRTITSNDIIIFSETYIVDVNYFNEQIKSKNWLDLWQKKTDYIEYQINQFSKKFPLINTSSTYYLGLAENAISYLKYNNSSNSYYSISHKRINAKYTMVDLYNPLEFILDYKVRDISEYLKNYLLEKHDLSHSNVDLYLLKLNYEEIIYFISRMLYPTYYFDLVQEIIDGKVPQEKLNLYINKTDDFEKYMKKLMYEYSKVYNIDKIEWIIKT